MKNLILIGVVCTFWCFTEVNAQHYIGLDKVETNTLARKSGFYKETLTTSQKFNYLKFVNSLETKTLIVFFSDEDIATHTRMVVDYSELDNMLGKLDRDYQKISKNSWEYIQEGQIFEVTVEEKEWYFVIRTKAKI